MRERGITEPAAYLVIVAPHSAQSSSASTSQATPSTTSVPTSVPTSSLSTPQAPHSFLSSTSNHHPPPPSHSFIEQTGSSPPGRTTSTSNQTSPSSQAAATTLTQRTHSTMQRSEDDHVARPNSPRNPRSTVENSTGANAQSPPESPPSDSLLSTPASAAKSNSSISQPASQEFNVASNASHLIKPIAPRGLCKECGQRESECVLLPCGHLTLCFTCVQLSSVSLCPVCRSPVHSIVRTFLA